MRRDRRQSSGQKSRSPGDQFVSPLEVAHSNIRRQRNMVAACGAGGQMIGSMDLLIAANVVSLDVRLATHNSRSPAEKIGLAADDGRRKSAVVSFRWLPCGYPSLKNLKIVRKNT